MELKTPPPSWKIPLKFSIILEYFPLPLLATLQTKHSRCHQTHLLKQTHFEANATLHLLLLTKTILLSPALSDSQQKRAIADKILEISSKCANYEPFL